MNARGTGAIASRYLDRAGPIAAGLATALSASIVLGWLTRDPDLLMLPLYWGPPMYFPVAIVSLMSGISLGIDGRLPPTTKLLMRQLFAALVISLGTAYVLEVLTKIDLGVDFRRFHAAVDTFSRDPGRPSPYASLSVLLLGVGLASLTFKSSRWTRIVTYATSFAISGIGLFGILVYLLHLRFLNLWVTQTTLAAPTAVIYFLLGVALLSAAERNRAIGATDLSDFQRIIATSISVLLIAAMVIGLSSLAVMQQQLQRVEERLTLTALSMRQENIRREVDRSVENARQFAGELSGLAMPASEDTLPPRLARTVNDSTSTGGRFTAVAVVTQDRSARLLAGHFTTDMVARIDIAEDVPVTLLATPRRGLFLQVDVPVRTAASLHDRIRVEAPLPITTSLMSLHLPWRGSQLFLCGAPGRQARCVTHANDQFVNLGDQAPDMLRVLTQHEDPGAFEGHDASQRLVTMASREIGRTGLRVGFSIPSVEIFAPSHIALQRLIFIILICVTAGVVAMGRRLRPMTERLRMAMDRANDNYQHFIAAAESAHDALSILEAIRNRHGKIEDFRFVYTNKAGAATLGKAPQEIIGGLLLQQYGGCPEVEAFFAQCVNVVEDGVPAVFDSAHTSVDGRRIARHLTKSQDQVFSIGRDITESARGLQFMTSLAMTDVLTKLPNRRAFDIALADACARAAENQYAIAVAFCDIDDFKSINDRYGHACGDEMLIAFAHTLHAAVRKSDLVARLSGDEFVVLIENLSSEAEALAVTAAIRAAVDKPMHVCERSIMMNVSVGCAVAHGAQATPADLLERADTAMYTEKSQRKNSENRPNPVHTIMHAGE